MHILSYYGCNGSIVWNEREMIEFVVCLVADFEGNLHDKNDYHYKLQFLISKPFNNQI